MVKIPEIKGGSIHAAVNNIRKPEMKIGKSGLPLELPVDTFQKEQQIINKLNPATAYDNALRKIQNSLLSMKK